MLARILFARRMMQIWYSWKGGREGEQSENNYSCLATRADRNKIEEIKKKTNYYSTRNLIEKYDESSPVTPDATPLRRRNVAPSVSPTPLSLQPQQKSPKSPQTPNGEAKALALQLSPTPQPIQATRKQWYDKLADAILGDDEPSVSSAASRYALICQKCFAHNGLVKESQWEDTQYICPKCGFFNPSARSKKQATMRTPSPPSASSRSPARLAEHEPPSHALKDSQQAPVNDAPPTPSDVKRTEESMAMDIE
ncbi:hypothetical protein ID866_8353 [Astraeus odoratus]|nr:hypothetical protein ID866_8353 [Astraeus odoratus]